MKVYNYIIKNYISANPGDVILKYKQQLVSGESVVVLHNEQFMGLITLKDVFDKLDGLVVDALVPKPEIQVDDDPLAVLKIMFENNFDFLPVMEVGKFQGIISCKKLMFGIILSQRNNDLLKKDGEILELRKEISLKNKFWVIIGHDIKNLFMQVSGSLELLDRKLRNIDDSKIQAALRLARRSAEQVNSAFDDMLLWARLGTGQLPFRPERLQLKEHIEKMVNQFQLAGNVKNITVKHSLNNELIIFADPNMLGCVLLNLVYNAIKFTPAGGEVILNALEHQNQIEIIVHDNGLGMSFQQQEQLFTQGHSTQGTENEMGAGIGLIICKDFVERHGGKIAVESVYGQGTCVIVTLPHQASVYKCENLFA